MLQDAEPNSNELETIYSKIVSECTKSRKDCLGLKVKNKAKEWISTWEAVDARRTLKKKLTDAKSERLQYKLSQRYKKANKKIKNVPS